VSSTVSTEKNPHDGPRTSTLGQLLYSNPQGPRPSEEEWRSLISAIGSGDQRALQNLFQRAHRIAFTLTLRIVNSRESAEELTVDTFHEVWRRASGYDPAQGTVIGWVMSIARSKAIDRLRFEQRRKRVKPHPESPEMPAASPESGMADLVESKQQRSRLREVLNVLTEGERQAVELAFFGEHTYAEVSERANLPLGTVKTRIRTGLMKLRRALAEEGSQ
jgi:RNA polymerase sigma-70 factor (ECF subfamily)